MKENKDDKKHSRRFLVFYVIALFSIALVLVLLSYLTQLRSARQLASMTDKLNEQTTVAQGAREQMETLQKQAEEQGRKLKELNAVLDELEETLDVGEGEDLTAAAKQMYDENTALELLAKATALEERDPAAADEVLDELLQEYGAGRLDGSADNAVFTGDSAQAYLALRGRIAD